ncbi:hypothetical protein [Geoalkalibacter halelectricus]|uniref:hypothetical protein n=1 Tax=Geoalkalibacter halelectricus TaxID=2847045 RepID=UPI003D20DA30
MKKALLAAMVMVMALALAAVAAEPSRMALEVGEQIYACGCGVNCPCDTLAKRDGKCTCGRDMVRAEVLEVGEDEAVIRIAGEKRTVKTLAKYVCACGPACPCVAISQNSGKCVCGRDMAAVTH